MRLLKSQRLCLGFVLSSCGWMAGPASGATVHLERAGQSIELKSSKLEEQQGKTRADSIASLCVPEAVIEFRKAETLSAGEDDTVLGITVVRMDVPPSRSGDPAKAFSQRLPVQCFSGTVSGKEELQVNPSRIWCDDDKPVVNGGLVYIESGAHSACLEIANARWLNYGSDYGFALNLVDREGDEEAFDVQQGFSGYWALATLKSRTFRPIVNVSLLDFDKEGHDIEIGLGVGFIFKPTGLETETGKGFSIGVGYGRDLMIRGKDNPEFWFVGLGFNVPSAAPSTGAAR